MKKFMMIFILIFNIIWSTSRAFAAVDTFSPTFLDIQQMSELGYEVTEFSDKKYSYDEIKSRNDILWLYNIYIKAHYIEGVGRQYRINSESFIEIIIADYSHSGLIAQDSDNKYLEKETENGSKIYTRMDNYGRYKIIIRFHNIQLEDESIDTVIISLDNVYEKQIEYLEVPEDISIPFNSFSSFMWFALVFVTATYLFIGNFVAILFTRLAGKSITRGRLESFSKKIPLKVQIIKRTPIQNKQNFLRDLLNCLFTPTLFILLFYFTPSTISLYTSFILFFVVISIINFGSYFLSYRVQSKIKRGEGIIAFLVSNIVASIFMTVSVVFVFIGSSVFVWANETLITIGLCYLFVGYKLLTYDVDSLRFVQRLIKKLTRRNDLSILDNESQSMYFRAFSDDNLYMRSTKHMSKSLLEKFSLRKKERFEEILANEISRRSSLVAIGNPKTLLVELGAEKVFLKDDEWQNFAIQKMLEADYIIYSIGRTKMVIWEILIIRKLEVMYKSIFIIPPVSVYEKRLRLKILFELLGIPKEQYKIILENKALNNLLLLYFDRDAELNLVYAETVSDISFGEGLDIAMDEISKNIDCVESTLSSKNPDLSAIIEKSVFKKVKRNVILNAVIKVLFEMI